MILPSQALRAYAARHNLQWPFIGPANVDLCLGPSIIGYHKDGGREVRFDCLNPKWLYPGWFYLASSLEEVYCDDTVAGFMQMQPSLARAGLGHKLAGFVPPGFRGQIPFELETSRVVQVIAGNRIAQLILLRLTDPTSTPYTSKYLSQQDAHDA